MKKFLIIAFMTVGLVTYAQQTNTTYYENGKVKTHQFLNGENLIQTTYYINGNVKEVGSLKKGKPHGFWKTYSEDNQVLSVGYYNEGVKTGDWIVQANNETERFVLNYSNGKRTRAERFE